MPQIPASPTKRITRNRSGSEEGSQSNKGSDEGEVLDVITERDEDDEDDDGVLRPDPKFVIPKIPLDESNPTVWLQRYEDAFLCKGFTCGRQKKVNILSYLTPHQIGRLNLEYDCTYKELKAEIIKVYSQTEAQKLNALLACFPKHDELPTVYLARFREHCPPGKDYSIATNRMIQYLYINRLKPAELIVHVAGAMFQQKQPITDIAVECDNYVIRNRESKHQAQGPAEVNHMAEDSPPRAALVQAVFERPDRKRRNPGPPPRVRPQETKRFKGGLCDRHWAFGNKAYSCDGGGCLRQNEPIQAPGRPNYPGQRGNGRGRRGN